VIFETKGVAPDARGSKSAIDLKVDGEYPDIHARIFAEDLLS
jgi:hypothetical protein